MNRWTIIKYFLEGIGLVLNLVIYELCRPFIIKALKDLFEEKK